MEGFLNRLTQVDEDGNSSGMAGWNSDTCLALDAPSQSEEQFNRRYHALCIQMWNTEGPVKRVDRKGGHYSGCFTNTTGKKAKMRQLNTCLAGTQELVSDFGFL